jgi:hypothetical protein
VRLVPAIASLVLLSVLAPAVSAQSAKATFDPPSVAVIVDPGPGPTPTPTSSPPSSPGASDSSHSSGSSFPLLTQDQANGLFDGFLLHGFERAADGIRRGLRRLVDDANVVTNTSATWTYQQPTVVALQRAVQTTSNAALALLIFWMGLTVLLRPQLGGASLEVREVIPRLVLGAGLANSAGHWTALAIDLNNAACAQLLAANSGSLADLLGQIPIFDHTWLIGLLLVAFLVVWVWLYLKMAGRMAMLMVLLVLAPAAQLCWVLPQTRGLADRWHGRFWTTLYAQIVVTASLKLAWGFASATGFNPTALLISICLLFLAASSPDLLAGGAARIGLGGILELALLAARASAPGPAAASGGAALAGAAARGVSSGGSSVAASSVPRVKASPIATSAQYGGTGGGTAATGKPSGFGRGGRSSGAATSKGRDPDAEPTP